MNVPINSSGIAAVLLKNNHVLLLKRNDAPLQGAWCYIGGGIEEGERAWEAALREIEEETGVTDVSLYTSNTFDQFYSPEQNEIYIAPVFVGLVKEATPIVLNDEHSEYRWLTIEAAKEQATMPGNDQVLEFIEKHFVQQAPRKQLHIVTRSE
ncbi:NUDIX pyrophosphatase [Geomicrobium sp. JCM 19039]|uniref:NUDIX hydrolase n=1 Tax=Geomicrobium sp. JCM 19039 TaxID=1460636 RepID=UPI00045F298B|nr:NUDIX domain-containing protein [Geomicrobium sp. JCM 19039]GAK14081.1 NTP pyrophosphohydrolase [Geomicrobium sp. JCM 19039]